MVRPHIDFLQSQLLPWQASRWAHLPGCQTKILSRDPDTGAMSLLVRFPAGWALSESGFLAAGEELFVIDGALDLDGRRFGVDCYGFCAAGCRHAARAAPDGAVALVFYDAEPAWRRDAPPVNSPPVMSFVDAFEVAWLAAGMVAAYGTGHRTKFLRGSMASTSATLLLSTGPHLHPPGWLAPQVIHPCTEELFLLSGDFLCSAGAMASGAYVWRPAGIPHGPYASRGGNLALLRTHGAPLSTRYTAHEITLERVPEYQPVLPGEFAAHVAHPWRAQRY